MPSNARRLVVRQKWSWDIGGLIRAYLHPSPYVHNAHSDGHQQDKIRPGVAGVGNGGDKGRLDRCALTPQEMRVTKGRVSTRESQARGDTTQRVSVSNKSTHHIQASWHSRPDPLHLQGVTSGSPIIQRLHSLSPLSTRKEKKRKRKRRKKRKRTTASVHPGGMRI